MISVVDDTETAHRARSLAQMLRDALEAGVPGWLVNPVHACIIDLETMSTWRAGGCPGRLRLVGGRTVSPSALVGRDVPVEVHRVRSARDPVHVAALADGGVISYRQAAGSFVHTLNTVDGFRRKLLALGIAPPNI